MTIDNVLLRGRGVGLSPDAGRAERDPEATRQAGDGTGGHRSRLARLRATLAEWIRRRRERRELMAIDDRILHDLGLSRTDALEEARKPFWKP